MAKEGAGKGAKNRIPSKCWTKYKIEGGKLSRGKTCPKCGAGYFLAEHKDRTYCGKCHYSEFKSKKVEDVKKK